MYSGFKQTVQSWCNTVSVSVLSIIKGCVVTLFYYKYQIEYIWQRNVNPVVFCFLKTELTIKCFDVFIL